MTVRLPGKGQKKKRLYEQSGTILKNAENLDEIPLANTAEADYNALKRESEKNETETTAKRNGGHCQ